MNHPRPQIRVTSADATDGLPVVVGFPFREGELRDPGTIALVDPGNTDCPVDARALIQWPDGSIRWALLAFRARQTGLHSVTWDGGEAPAAGVVSNNGAVTVEQRDDGVSISNGTLRIDLARRGPGPVRRLRVGAWEAIDRPEQLRFEVDDASTLHETERSIHVLESSPLRARVRIEGAHFTPAGQRRLSYYLDVELWAGWSSVRLDYQFYNLERGRDALPVRRIRAHAQVNVGANPRRHLYQRRSGALAVPRTVQNPAPVALRVDFSRNAPYVEDRAMLLDDTPTPFYMTPSVADTDEWLGVTGPAGTCYLAMESLVPMKPKRLLSADDWLALDIWPEEAEELQLLQGRARRQTLVLGFAPPAGKQPLEAAQVRRLLTGLQHEGRATPASDWARHVGVFDVDRTLRPGKSVRFEKYLGRLMSLRYPTGMWDLGDNTEDNYVRGYIAIGRQPRRPGAGPDPATLSMRPISPHGYEYTPIEQYEAVWANNEYDLIHSLCLELLRSERHELWTLLRHAVRHNVEVDFIHYSDDPWQHHGSPAHSANHNFSSAYPSHLWTQGLLEYYCLTGDPDALYVAERIGETIIRNLHDPVRGKILLGFNREVGWPVLALVQLYDVTRKEVYRRELDELLAFLMAFDRHGNKKAVNLSGVNPLHDMHRQIVSAFFGYFAMVEGIERYARLTGREDVRDWVKQFMNDVRVAADRAHAEGEALDLRRVLPLGMAIGYELTGETDFIRVAMLSLEEFMDTELWAAPPGEFKAAAMIHRGLVRFLHHAQESGLLDELEYHFAKGKPESRSPKSE